MTPTRRSILVASTMIVAVGISSCGSAETNADLDARAPATATGEDPSTTMTTPEGVIIVTDEVLAGQPLVELPEPVDMGSVTLTMVLPGLRVTLAGPLRRPPDAPGFATSANLAEPVDEAPLEPLRTGGTSAGPGQVEVELPASPEMVLTVTDGLTAEQAAAGMAREWGPTEIYRIGDVEVHVAPVQLDIADPNDPAYPVDDTGWVASKALLPSGTILELNGWEAEPLQLLAVLAPLMEAH